MLDSFQSSGGRAAVLAMVLGLVPAFCAAQQSFLGVGVQEVDASLAEQLKLNEVRGVAVTSVVDDSAAAGAGIEKGDVVLAYNGQQVIGVEQFQRLVRETPVGREVTLAVSRDGDQRTVNVTMGSRTGIRAVVGSTTLPFESSSQAFDALRNFRFPDTPQVFTTWRSSTLGIEAESLNDQLADYFGVEEGVLVRSVGEDSAAEKAGFRAGDVILEVGGDKVTTPREVTNALRDQEPGEVAVAIMRDHQQRELSVTIEAPARPTRMQFVSPFHFGGTTISF